MKIAFVLAGLSAGGAERVISLISAEWASQGHDISIIAFDSPAEPVYHPFNPRVRLERLDLTTASGCRLKGLATNIQRILRLRAVLKREKPDIVISFLTKINAVTLAATIGLRVPVIVSERNNPRRQLAHPLWNLILRTLYARATQIVMQTRASVSSLPAKVRHLAAVIPNPVAIPQSQATAVSSIFTAVGRLVEQKGFDLLIEAFARIAPVLPQWRLVIWGEGDERAELERKIEALGLRGRVELPGLTRHAGEWTQDASIFVLSSRYEGFPNVLAEAMATGLGAISFDCPFGPSEIIRNGEDGLIVPTEDVGGLANAMEKLAMDPELRKQLSANARHSIRRFDASAVIARWQEVVMRNTGPVTPAN